MSDRLIRTAGRARRPGVRHDGWRRALRRDLGWVLALKLAALLLLWYLFFSPAHRQDVDSEATSRKLAVGTAAPAAEKTSD